MQNWIASNQAQIDEIATKLVNQTKSEEDPDPNPNVLPYNPALDVQKPKEMLKYLKWVTDSFDLEMIVNSRFAALIMSFSSSTTPHLYVLHLCLSNAFSIQSV